MDRLLRTRRVFIRNVEKEILKVEDLLMLEVPDLDRLRLMLDTLETDRNRILDINGAIFDAMLETEAEEGELDTEHSSAQEFDSRVKLMKIRIEGQLHSVMQPSLPSLDLSDRLQPNEQLGDLKLPKIQIKKFNGEYLEWLSWWAQYQSIHDNPRLNSSNKFQYLVSSILPRTRAWEVVNRYAQTSENYPKVVQALQERFGNKDLLKQLYLRELYDLVYQNSTQRDGSLGPFYDKLENLLQSLESLDVTKGEMAVFLYPLVESRLPMDIYIVWQRSSWYRAEGTKSKLENLMDFLKSEVENEDKRILFQGKGSRKSRSQEVKGNFENEEFPTVAGLHVGDRPMCIFCDKNHESNNCNKALSMSYEDKEAIIKKKRCCFACLRQGHFKTACRVRCICTRCGKPHLTVICPAGRLKPFENRDVSGVKVTAVQDTIACCSKVILGTLKVKIVAADGETEVRVLCDPGSQRNYITKKVVTALDLQPCGHDKLVHTVFGGMTSEVEFHKLFNIKVRSQKGTGSRSLIALDKDRICGEIPRMRCGSWLKELKEKGIWISDVGDDNPEIDLLIGASGFADILTGRKHNLSNGLKALETSLGWILMGECVTRDAEEDSSIAMVVTDLHNSTASIQQLWDLEVIGIRDPVEHKTQTQKDELAKIHFLKTVTRLKNGRYSISLPWVDGKQVIPDNRTVAEKRLEATTNKLVRENLMDNYGRIFEDWALEGIIEEVDEADYDKPAHYLPHRAVLKPESLTTPIRPVFDASCKSRRTPSLNECLERGPNLVELIPSVLLRFREKRVGVVSDIRKAFQMIEVNVEDRDSLRFLWWEDYSRRKFRIYRHKRVVFGVNCSPFLLAAVLELHLKSVGEEMRPIADKLLSSLYVDNCVTSVESYEEYENFRDKAIKLMKEAEMDLRMWQSSVVRDSRVSLINERGLESNSTLEVDCTLTSVLGLIWNMKEDVLSCDVENIKIEEDVLTRRGITSCYHKVYDPIGFLGPALLFPKLLLQKTWEAKMTWDSPVSDEMKEEFDKWQGQLHSLKNLKIPRDASGGSNSRDSWELHTFCDASQNAYATVVFLRTETDKRVSVQLLQAKSRIAPLKKISINRLELMSCTIGARLTQSVVEALKLEEVPKYYWSDSSNALAWIRRNDDWGTFVGNRVREIIRLSRVQDWNHVPGIDNPADLPSRGCTPDQLLSSRWWEGPKWLYGSRETWPKIQGPIPNENEVSMEKKKTSVISLVTTGESDIWYLRKSSFYANVRILAWVRRAIACLRKDKRHEEYLTLDEIKTAELKMVCMVQGEVFSTNDEVISGIKIQRIEGCIRVQTKLSFRKDFENFKFPVLLPHEHPIVTQIVEEMHRVHGHAGIQFLMGKLREKYWILRGRKAIRGIIHRCVTCRRYQRMKTNVEPCPLPEERVKTSKVFESVGVDLMGPLNLKNKKKVWVLIITCAVFRCVHLEIVTSLSTEDFLMAFTKFCSIRGRPSVVFSDNGTNFVGAVSTLKKIDWEKVTKDCGLVGIRWKFNPPSAAWWGGWWERLIRTVKDLLRKCFGRSKVTEKRLELYLAEATAIINGRPLTTVTEEPDDLIPLTPAMFLTDIPMTNYVDLDFLSSEQFQSAYQERCRMVMDFKKRFRNEYLGLLVQRQKDKKIHDLRVGDVVLIGDDNKKRWEWPLARIVEVFHGRDGNVRVVKVKTACGFLVRPVQRVFSLEVSSPHDVIRH